MSDDHKPPPPRSTPKPYANGAEHEPVSGVFQTRTGRTRRYVKWGAVIGGIVTLLTPVMNAIALRISPPAPPVIVREPLLQPRDGGQ